MKLSLTIALATLILSAPAFADKVPEGAKLYAYRPVGNGDPNAVTCWAYRTTPPLRGLQCARNSYWARLNHLSRNPLDGQSSQPPQMSGGLPSPFSSNNR